MTTATGRHVTGPAGTLFVDADGTDRGKLPVVLVHSFGGSTAQWAQQLQHLRRVRRAVALDFRGHGESAPPKDGDYAIESLAADIGAVLDGLGLATVVLVGHGLGAKAALEYARTDPNRVAGLLLAAAPARIPADQAAQMVAGLEQDLRADERGHQRAPPDRRDRRRAGTHRPRWGARRARCGTVDHQGFTHA